MDYRDQAIQEKRDITTRLTMMKEDMRRAHFGMASHEAGAHCWYKALLREQQQLKNRLWQVEARLAQLPRPRGQPPANHRCGIAAEAEEYVEWNGRRFRACHCGDGPEPHCHPFSCADVERALANSIPPLFPEGAG